MAKKTVDQELKKKLEALMNNNKEIDDELQRDRESLHSNE